MRVPPQFVHPDAPLFLAPAAVIVRVADGSWPTLAPLAESTRLSGYGWLVGLLIPALAYAIGEEVGWRGFALPRLQARHRPLIAALLLGLIWVAWHDPFYLYLAGMVEARGAEVVAQGVLIIISGFFLAWLYNSTGGSILLVALWHGTHSVVHIAIPETSPSWDTWGGVLSTFLAIIVAIVWWRHLSTGSPHAVGDR